MSGKARPERRQRGRRFAPGVARLEGRALLSVNGGLETVHVTPAVLPPPANGRQVEVFVQGTLSSNKPTPPDGFFFVTDQYHNDEPRGHFAVSPAPVSVRVINNMNWYSYDYAFGVSLQDKRSVSPNTRDGRFYDLFVGGTDADGSDGRTTRVNVPAVYPYPTLAPAHVRPAARRQGRGH